MLQCTSNACANPETIDLLHFELGEQITAVHGRGVPERRHHSARAINIGRSDEQVRVAARPQRGCIVDRVRERRALDQDGSTSARRERVRRPRVFRRRAAAPRPRARAPAPRAPPEARPAIRRRRSILPLDDGRGATTLLRRRSPSGRRPRCAGPPMSRWRRRETARAQGIARGRARNLTQYTAWFQHERHRGRVESRRTSDGR